MKFGQLVLRKITKNCCNQMSDFTAKMHQKTFGGRASPGVDPVGSLSAPPHPLAAKRGPTSKGREGREGEERRGGRGREGWEGKRGGEEKGRGGREKGEGGGRVREAMTAS